MKRILTTVVTILIVFLGGATSSEGGTIRISAVALKNYGDSKANDARGSASLLIGSRTRP
jgi:hypothetical protein